MLFSLDKKGRTAPWACRIVAPFDREVLILCTFVSLIKCFKTIKESKDVKMSGYWPICDKLILHSKPIKHWSK